MRSVCRLDELVAAVDDKTGLAKDPALPYLGLEHIGQRGTGLNGTSASSASISINSIFKAGDVLFGKLRPNLRKCALAPFDGYCSTDVLVLRPQSGVDPRFAARIFQTERVGAAAEKTAAGTKMPRTSWNELRALEVFCPDSRSQERISDVLDALDTTIRQTEAIIEKLKQVKQGLLHDLLTRGIDANGELRPPQSQAPHLYKDSPLGWIPKEWSAETIDSLAGYVGSGVTPSGGSDTYVDSGALFIRSQNVHFNGLRLNDAAYIDMPTHAAMSRSELQPFDVLLNITGASIGRCCVFPEGIGAANVNQHVCAIRLGHVYRAQALLLTAFLASAFGQGQIDRFNAGGSREGLNYEQVRSIIVRWPKEAEADRIVSALGALDDRIAFEEAEAMKCQALKGGLMDDLLTGRVRVTSLLA